MKTTRESISELLRRYVSDPNQKRKERDKDFIFHDVPRHDSTMPRIGMQEVSGEAVSYALNTNRRQRRVRLQLILYGLKTGKYEQSDGTVLRGVEVLDKLATRVINVLTSKAEEEISEVYHLRVVSVVDSPSGTSLLQKNVDLEYKEIIGVDNL